MNKYEFITLMFFGTTVLLDILTRIYNILLKESRRLTPLQKDIMERRKKAREFNKKYPGAFEIPSWGEWRPYKMWPLKELLKTIRRYIRRIVWNKDY